MEVLFLVGGSSRSGSTLRCGLPGKGSLDRPHAGGNASQDGRLPPGGQDRRSVTATTPPRSLRAIPALDRSRRPTAFLPRPTHRRHPALAHRRHPHPPPVAPAQAGAQRAARAGGEMDPGRRRGDIECVAPSCPTGCPPQDRHRFFRQTYPRPLAPVVFSSRPPHRSEIMTSGWCGGGWVGWQSCCPRPKARRHDPVRRGRRYRRRIRPMRDGSRDKAATHKAAA
jgi:hypothetical protein